MRDGLGVRIAGFELRLEGLGKSDDVDLTVEVLASDRAFDLRDDRQRSVVSGGTNGSVM